MSKFVQIILLVALPLAWGLAVEYAFERLRRHRKHRAGRRFEGGEGPGEEPCDLDREGPV